MGLEKVRVHSRGRLILIFLLLRRLHCDQICYILLPDSVGCAYRQQAHAVLGMNSTATRLGTFPVYRRAFHMNYAYHCHYLNYSQRTLWPISTLNLLLNAHRNLYNGLTRRTAE